MTVSQYTLLILSIVLANLPFLSNRFLGIIPLRRKRFIYCLAELIIFYVVLGIVGYILESRAGVVHTQDWVFYVVTSLIFIIFSFPAFVWRYFWQSKYRE